MVQYCSFRKTVRLFALQARNFGSDHWIQTAVRPLNGLHLHKLEARRICRHSFVLPRICIDKSSGGAGVCIARSEQLFAFNLQSGVQRSHCIVCERSRSSLQMAHPKRWRSGTQKEQSHMPCTNWRRIDCQSNQLPGSLVLLQYIKQPKCLAAAL